MKNKVKVITTPRSKIMRKEYALQVRMAEKIANNDELVSDGNKLDAWRSAIAGKIIVSHGRLSVLSIERDCWEFASKELDNKLEVSQYGNSRQVARAKGNVLEDLKCTIKRIDVELSEIQTRLSHWENLKRIIECYDEDSAFEFLIRVSGFRSNV